MTHVQAIPVGAQAITRFLPLLGEDSIREAEEGAAIAQSHQAGRVFWNINSTAHGGGVAEMLPTLVGYARNAGIDARWLVIEGAPEFFRLTKRLHHALHGSSGDGSALSEPERALYEQALRANSKELDGVIQPRDVVVLHASQTAGLAPDLIRRGAVVIWRCHIGGDRTDERTCLIGICSPAHDRQGGRRGRVSLS